MQEIRSALLETALAIFLMTAAGIWLLSLVQRSLLLSLERDAPHATLDSGEAGPR